MSPTHQIMLACHTRAAVAALLLLGGVLPSVALAQTDYFNTDAGRPVRIEDAYAIERRAIELQVAPLRLERERGGGYRWGLEPEIAVGLLPRTQVEIGFPLVHTEGAAGVRTTALAGLEMSALYNLNAETRLPALALVADVVVPAGPLGPSTTIPSLKAIATKTFAWARFHVNGQVTFADDPLATGSRNAGVAPANAEFTRWLGGIAIDKALPLRSMLLTAEVVTSQPLVRSAARRWDVAGGTRVQLSPRVAFDAGGGYRLAGDEPGWFVTTGAAVAIGLPWSTR
ncbi:MAG: hypothetical protein ACK5XT_04520 [Gemmatimonas sp.]|uniref:hypothetical protein n=1 Tax=Gemmatimonas sp. TaxID=1962908 RepID=UPI00391F152E|nr:hypothetical protein [Gemmatimonadota bacterium]